MPLPSNEVLFGDYPTGVDRYIRDWNPELTSFDWLII